MVPSRKPKMVERNVKAMSVQASPVVKKIVSVRKIALGCDQKKASIQPRVAAVSQSPIAPTRMPICAASMAQRGHSRSTGSRRTGLAGQCASAGRTRPAKIGGADARGCPERSCDCLPVMALGRPGWETCRWSGAEASLLRCKELGREHALRSRGRSIDTGIVSTMRPGRVAITCTSSDRKIASSMSCVTKTTVLPKSLQSCISHSCICNLVWASSAPNGSSSRITSVSNRSVRSSAARWRIPPESALG